LNNKIIFKCRRVRLFRYEKLKRSSSKIAHCNSQIIHLLMPLQKFDLAFAYVLLCLFIYSCRAFSNSSLILRVEPVSFTTNFIHSVHIRLSIFMEVFVFLSACRILLTIPSTVHKVNGNYHKLNIETCGNMVLRYNGSIRHIQLQTKTQSPKGEDAAIR
jgi:hypothetical protein